jgi:hypothetical protein
MTITFQTVVLRLPPTPLGLLPERWVVEHWCPTCRHSVGTEELLAHAQAHHRASRPSASTRPAPPGLDAPDIPPLPPPPQGGVGVKPSSTGLW